MQLRFSVDTELIVSNEIPPEAAGLIECVSADACPKRNLVLDDETEDILTFL